MASRVVQFGVFQAHLDSGELYRDGIKLKLGGQPFQVLEYLLARPGEVVTREELRTTLWQADTFVDFDHGLNTAINKIREALGDSASNPRFVETVPRRGYRFIAPVDRPVQVEPEPAPEVPPVPSPPAVPSRKWTWVAAAVIGVGLITIIGWATFRARPKVSTGYKLTQVTRDSGLTWQPNISSDGNFVVYASDRATGKDLDIWIQHVSGGQPVRLTSTPIHESHPSLSGDGRRVVFQSGLSVEERGIFLVPSLGGSPKLVLPAGRHPSISPDGTMVAFSSGGLLQTSEIRVISTEGGEARTVPVGNWAVAPIWTPDGRGLFAWASGRAGPSNDFWSVVLPGGAANKTGAAERLRALGATPMMQTPYSQDPVPAASAIEGGMVIAARSGDGHDLWFCPVPGGPSAPPVRITVGAGAAHPSAAANGRIAFSRIAVNSGLWMLPLDAQSGVVKDERRRVWNENVTVGYPSVSADGKKLVYVSNRGGDPDVWLRDLETGADRQLTANKDHEFRAMISRDGRRVAFGGGGQTYTMSTDGGVATAIPNFKRVNVAGWTPDGKLLYYSGWPIRDATVEIETGRKQDIAWHPSLHLHNGRISPDGRWITFTAVGEATRVVYVAPLENGGGGKPESWIRISGEGQATNSFWSPDGNLLYVHQGDTLWARKLRPDTKQPVGDAIVVQRFNGPRVSAIFSADGLTRDALYFMLEETTSNIWLADPVVR